MLISAGFALLMLGGCGHFSRDRKGESSTSFPTDPLQNAEVSEYVASVYQRVVPSTSKERHFVDVFATSWVQGQSWTGGKISITRGMLNVIVNEAELACLLGHEIAHQEHNHLDKRRQHAKSTSRLTELLPKVGGNIPIGKQAAFSDLFEDISSSGWSMASEQEADRFGAKYCEDAGYDPFAFVDLFERLAKLTGGSPGIGFPSLKKTHRELGARAKSLRAFLQGRGNTPLIRKRNYRPYMRSLASLAEPELSDPTPGGGGVRQFMAERINQPRPIWGAGALERLDRDIHAATNRFLGEQCEEVGSGIVDAHVWDAFGHCLYACEGTQRFGWDRTYAAGTGREYFREIEDALGIAGHDSYQQDLDNQAFGRGADPNPVPGGTRGNGDGGIPEIGNNSCYDYCLEGYRSGRLNLSAPRGRNCYSCGMEEMSPRFCR